MLYTNQYGEVVIEIVSAYMSIKQVKSQDVPEDCWLDINQVEQLALITENRHLQIGFSKNLRQAYVVHHKNSNTVAYCRVTNINFYINAGKNASEILAQQHYVTYPCW